MHLTRMAVGSTRRFAWVASMLALSLAIPAAAAGKRPPPSTYWEGQSPEQAAAAILRAGQEAAGKDSWENIAVARVWYLSGQREQARPILQNYGRADSKEASDLYRIGTIHCEAKEYDRAQWYFDRALALESDSDKTLVAMGVCAMSAGNREKAELYFKRALDMSPDNPWLLAAIGAAYLGVRPDLN